MRAHNHAIREYNYHQQQGARGSVARLQLHHVALAELGLQVLV